MTSPGKRPRKPASARAPGRTDGVVKVGRGVKMLYAELDLWTVEMKFKTAAERGPARRQRRRGRLGPIAADR